MLSRFGISLIGIPVQNSGVPAHVDLRPPQSNWPLTFQTGLAIEISVDSIQ